MGGGGGYVRLRGEYMVGSGIPKVVRTRGNGEKLCKIIETEAGTTKEAGGTEE